MSDIKTPAYQADEDPGSIAARPPTPSSSGSHDNAGKPAKAVGGAVQGSGAGAGGGGVEDDPNDGDRTATDGARRPHEADGNEATP